MTDSMTGAPATDVTAEAPVTASTPPPAAPKMVLPRDGLVSDTREVAAIVRTGASIGGDLDPQLRPFVEGIEGVLGALDAAMGALRSEVADLRLHASGAVKRPPTA